MNRRTFLKSVGATIASIATGIGAVKNTKVIGMKTTESYRLLNNKPVVLVMGVDRTSGDDSCCVQLFKRNANGEAELIDTKLIPLKHWPPDYGEISMYFKEKPSRIIYERNNDHELHVEAYNNFMKVHRKQNLI